VHLDLQQCDVRSCSDAACAFCPRGPQYGTVYVKATHGQGPKRGTVLTDGVLSTRTMTEVAADLIGLSRAQVAEQLPAGTIRIAPLGCY